MHTVLLLENDLEKINVEITELERILQQDEESKIPKKGKIILAMMPFIIGMSFYGIAALVSPSLFSDIISITIGLVLGTAAVDIAFIANTRYHSHHINGIKNELSTAYHLREELEQRLSNSKEKTKDSIIPNIVESKEISPKINDVVILEESTQFFEEATNKLYESYTTGYDKKVKRRTLKK